jgi:hypothetical protein
MASVPFPAPRVFRWCFSPYFWHWRAKPYLYDLDSGRRSWCFLVRSRGVAISQRIELKRSVEWQCAFFCAALSWPYMKPAPPPIDVPGSTPFQKMDNLFRAVIAVPKAEVDQREKQWQKSRGKKRKKTAKG